MPKEIKAFKCEGCSNLIHSVQRYVKVSNLTAQHQPASDDNDWKKGNQTLVVLEDVAFCSEECLASYVSSALKFKS